MKGHEIQVWQDSSLIDGKATRRCFEEFCSNKFGKIMKTANSDTLNCMKFAHYLPEYHRLLSGFNEQKINMLEIGVQHGGSYRLWKNYFGEDILRWTGIDINQKCLSLNKNMSANHGLVCCGSQADPDFLEDVGRRRGKFDVVIDDGSHQSEHIVASFKSLAKYVKDGGLYIIEDIHACYWKGYRGESDSLNALSYFLGLAHSLNIQAIRHERCSANLSSDELVAAPALMRKIELLPSMIVCHMGAPLPMIEWKAGEKTVIS